MDSIETGVSGTTAPVVLGAIKLIIGLGTIWLLYYLNWRLKSSHLIELAEKVPSVKSLNTLPILGHALNFLGDTQSKLIFISIS